MEVARSCGCGSAGLIVVHRAAILGTDQDRRTLLALGLVDGSTVHAFPTAMPDAEPKESPVLSAGLDAISTSACSQLAAGV